MYNTHTFSDDIKIMRPGNRHADEMRNITITRQFTKHAEGSVLIEFGDTKVICTASIEQSMPGFFAR